MSRLLNNIYAQWTNRVVALPTFFENLKTEVSVKEVDAIAIPFTMGKIYDISATWKVRTTAMDAERLESAIRQVREMLREEIYGDVRKQLRDLYFYAADGKYEKVRETVDELIREMYGGDG